MNTHKGRVEFNNFKILLDSGCSSTIVMRRLIEKLNTKKDNLIQWHTYAGNINTNLKVKIDFTLPEFSTSKIVTWNCHVDDSARDWY